MPQTSKKSSHRRPRSRSRRPPRAVPLIATDLKLSSHARSHFGDEIIETTLALLDEGVHAYKPLVQRFFELGAKYDLDPLTGEIWLAPERGQNGAAQEWACFVGRDGYLKEARRHHDFISCHGYPIYEHDEFAAHPNEAGNMIVEHKMVHPKYRGKLEGAYAVLYRDGAPTVLFYAPLDQYGQEGGVWNYEDALIVKCAVSYLLRTTYGVSGPVPHDEVSVGFHADRKALDASAETPLPPAIQALYDRVHEIDPRAFGLSELQARTRGASTEQLRKVELEMSEWISQQGEHDEREPIQADDGVRFLVCRRDELLATEGEELGEQQRSDIEEELRVIEGKLRDHGLPGDWSPPPEGPTKGGTARQ